MVAALSSIASRLRCRWTSAAAATAAATGWLLRPISDELLRSSSFHKLGSILKPAGIAIARYRWMQTAREQSVHGETIQIRDYLGDIERVPRDLDKKLENCIGVGDTTSSPSAEDELEITWMLANLDKKLEKKLTEVEVPVRDIVICLKELADLFLTKYQERNLISESTCYTNEDDICRKTTYLREMELVLNDLNSKLDDCSKFDGSANSSPPMDNEWDMEQTINNFYRNFDVKH